MRLTYRFVKPWTVIVIARIGVLTNSHKGAMVCFFAMVNLEDIIEPEWLEWYRKTPQERLLATEEAWAIYLELGGSLDPDVDSQCPFWSKEELAEFARRARQAPTRAFARSKA